MTMKSVHLLVLALVLGLGMTLIVLMLSRGQAWADDPTPSAVSARSVLSSRSVSSEARDVTPLDMSVAAAGDVIQVFTNTWSYSTLGLVYDSARGQVRYAHESQSSAHHPTIYDVNAFVPHTVMFSVSLSAQNSGWPWQIDNRTGAGYDFVADTYFLPDYNGDLSYADDNIVEIDTDGNILNAWEMDDEVGSNDSSDGSEIDNIIDIAVVPGSPTRYFVTAAYDGNVVYEINLTKTGAWWMPNSWNTVATYTVPILGDNLGIDYDAENEVLYHSGWHTTTIVITDLGCNEVARFDCPGAGGYNSGVTFIEGSSPPEVWVTDFSSDMTTRCESSLGRVPLVPGWGKLIAGPLGVEPWYPGLTIQTQTSDTIAIVDVITAIEAFTLTEHWDPAHLQLIDWIVDPPVGTVVTGTGMLQIVLPPGPPEVVEVTKWFHVEPCNWSSTTLEEVLVVEGTPPFEIRPVIITKLAPELHIDSVYDTEVFAGGITSFTLSYSNTGGYENDVWISNTFPITAPFIYAEPFPSYVAPGGQSVRWDVGDLAQGDAGSIDVYVFIDETVPTSNTITIWDGILNHVGELQDETWIAFHVKDAAFPIAWAKYVNGVLWHPGISFTLETSQTLMVEEFITPTAGNPTGFSLIEEWNPDELALASVLVLPSQYAALVLSPEPGVWSLVVPPGFDYGPLAIVKEFHVEPCIWPETILWESLEAWGEGVRVRPVLVSKWQPELWIDSFFDANIYSGREAEFVLTYGNDGGFETQAWINSVFPAQAPFAWSVPPPSDFDPSGRWAVWAVDPLHQGDGGSIDVVVEIAPGLFPSTTIEIWNGILNHANELQDETFIGYHVPPPVWNMWVDGKPWVPGLGVTAKTSDTITALDVISTHSVAAIVGRWNPEHLTLMYYTTEPPSVGIVLSGTGFLSWRFPGGVPGQITITKIFHVEPCTSTYTVLWEDLWVESVEWGRRPLHIDLEQISSVYLPLVLRAFP